MNPPDEYPVYPIRDLRDLFCQVVGRYAGRVALRSKRDGEYRPLTYAELQQRVIELATAFSELGLRKGDRVGILAENRTEWALTYLAAVSVGLVALPIDRDLTPREIRHILDFAQPRILVSSAKHGAKVNEFRPSLAYLEVHVTMDGPSARADLTLTELLERGRAALAGGNRFFEESAVEPDDLAAIIFTSGTTGNSKGVMLSQRNITANITAISRFVSIVDGVVLSVLPLHHTYECTAGFLVALYQGCEICYAENLRRIPENLREVGATVVLGVPLLFENFYRRIQEGIERKGRARFRLARGLASISQRVLGVNIRRRLFRQVHERLGGRLALFISGGAAVDPEVARGFRQLGIDFIQGYGMTEASPIISVNRLDYFKDDSVGLPLPGVEVKIVQGEILVRGESVMQGYYLNPAASEKALEEGWLHTGDLGYLDREGFLHINGRKKSVIVTPNGKNVYPEEVEARLNESPYILESLVWGGPHEDPARVEVEAIVVPDTEALDRRFGASRYDEAKVREVITGEVRRMCRELAPYKRVRKIVLRREEFQRTTTRKIKRYLYTARSRTVGVRD